MAVLLTILLLLSMDLGIWLYNDCPTIIIHGSRNMAVLITVLQILSMDLGTWLYYLLSYYYYPLI